MILSEPFGLEAPQPPPPPYISDLSCSSDPAPPFCDNSDQKMTVGNDLKVAANHEPHCHCPCHAPQQAQRHSVGHQFHHHGAFITEHQSRTPCRRFGQFRRGSRCRRDSHYRHRRRRLLFPIFLFLFAVLLVNYKPFQSLVSRTVHNIGDWTPQFIVDIFNAFIGLILECFGGNPILAGIFFLTFFFFVCWKVHRAAKHRRMRRRLTIAQEKDNDASCGENNVSLARTTEWFQRARDAICHHYSQWPIGLRRYHLLPTSTQDIEHLEEAEGFPDQRQDGQSTRSSISSSSRCSLCSDSSDSLHWSQVQEEDSSLEGEEHRILI